MAHKVFRSFDSKTHLWPYIFGIRMSILKIFIHLSKKNQSFAINGLSKDPCQFFSPIKWRCGCAVENIQYPMGSHDKFPIPVSRISMVATVIGYLYIYVMVNTFLQIINHQLLVDYYFTAKCLLAILILQSRLAPRTYLD